MLSTHKARVAAAVTARAADYTGHASLQAQVADRLAACLPALAAPRVLEVGCGTGFLTRHLLEAYPDGEFLITDLSEAMLEVCRVRLGGGDRRRVRFTVMDGEAPELAERFDLIASSMTLQWFADPARGLDRLHSRLDVGGHLVFATLGPESFPEWRRVLAAHGRPEGVVAMPRLPGIVHEEHRCLDFADGLAFLRQLRAIGAATPRDGYRPLSAGALRAALRDLDRDHGGRVTWHLVYGHLMS
jgi:malonyl-CoA O-methyltransferase